MSEVSAILYGQLVEEKKLMVRYDENTEGVIESEFTEDMVVEMQK